MMGRRQRKENFKDNCFFIFIFLFIFCDFFIRHSICVSYSTHQKAEKHARKGEIFSVSLFLWKLQMSSSVFSPFNERYAHPSSFSHFPVMMSGRPYSISFVILENQWQPKPFPLWPWPHPWSTPGQDSSALVSRAKLHWSSLKQFARKLLLSFKTLLYHSDWFLKQLGWVLNLTSRDGSPIFVPISLHTRNSPFTQKGLYLM